MKSLYNNQRTSQVLYPSMNTSTRIAVVGGGPSGLSAALALVKLGYKNVTVLEQHYKVGGMCGSALIDGRVYDVGGQVIARESSPTLVTLMNELGVELEETGHTCISRIDCLAKIKEEIKIVSDCLSLLPLTSSLQVEASGTGKLGVHAVSSLAHQLAPQYLKSHGFERGVPRAVAALFTASGYGYAQDMSYAYLHEFVRSSLGQPARVKGGYSSFWEKVTTLLPDVRCNVQVMGIQRREKIIQISVVDSTSTRTSASGQEQQPSVLNEKILEFDKIIMSGSVSIPRSNRIYRSSNSSNTMIPEREKAGELLDYTSEELDLFSEVETMDYYTTVLKISALDIPAAFYYPEHADDPSNMGHFVAMQRFYADTDVFLFWSYGTAEIHQERVTELLYADVQRMGGYVEALILQKKWRYFPHIPSTEMEAGFYDKLDELQGKNNTYHTGALLAFELTERNTTYSMGLINRCFGSTAEPLFVQRLVNYPLANGAEEILDYEPEELTELPGLEFPDLPSTDAYLSFYANHPVTRDRVVFTWLDNHGKESNKLTFSELDTRASIIAQHLLTSKKPVLKPGDRVVLLHPPGLEFIEAFLACLRAHILAVPLIPPDPTKSGGNQALEKLVNVTRITNSKAILSTRNYHSMVRAAASISLVKKKRIEWPDLPWIHTSCLQDGRYDASKALNSAAKTWMSLVQKGVTKLATASLGLHIYLAPASLQSKTMTANDLVEDNSVNEAAGPRNNSKQDTVDDAAAFSKVNHARDMNGTMNFICTNKYEPPPDLNEVCFLQFTSGSTGDAKGVMITHGALIHNVKSMRSAYKSTSRTLVVSWLPQYHDMGLIGGLLVSMVTGGALVIFSPITFIRKPMMWLETVEKYRATHTAAPNFGFELVLKRYEMLRARGHAKKLDLSSLHFLMVGAEPISSQAMRGFVETFWDAGVREKIFAPGFGMAENCVFICCAFGRNRPMLVDSQGRVCCGYTDRSRRWRVRSGSDPHSRKLPETWKDSCSDVRIVNPNSLEEVGDGVEGEIWLSSPSNGVGYWGMTEATEQTFGVHLSGASVDDHGIKFVRSGDLGRVIQGNLFVTGRIKDLIIVNGKNYYPSDIEKTVENCSPSLRPGCTSAFSAPAKVLQSKGVSFRSSTSEEAGIVVVVEVRDKINMQKNVRDLLVSQIKAVVAEEHGLQVAFVSLIKHSTIPKTTSGKIRRRECLKRFSEGTLSSITSSTNLSAKRGHTRLLQHPHVHAPARNQFEMQAENTGIKSKEEISSFLVLLVAEMTGLASSNINVTQSFETYSIDSQGTVAAASRLSEFLGTHVSAIQIYTSGCISELTDFCDDVLKKIYSRGTRGGVPLVLANNLGALEHAAAAPMSSLSLSSSEQHPVAYRDQLEYKESDSIYEKSEAQLENALEPSQKLKTGITALQILGMFYIGALLMMPAVYIYQKLTEIVVSGDLNTSRAGIILLSTALVPLAWIVYIAITGLVVSMFGTRILLPINHKCQTNAIPLWSVSYVRWWTLYRLQEFASNALAGNLRETVFLTYWYRLLGAEIDDGVYLDTVDITDPSLLSVGRGAVIGEGATIQSHEVNAGVVTFKSVRIGRGCMVGPYAVVQSGSVMAAGSRISALGKTNVGERVFTGQAQVQDKHHSTSPTMAMGQLLGLYLVGLISTVSALVAYMTFQWFASHMKIVTENSLRKGVTVYANHGYLVFPLLMTFPRFLFIVGLVMMFPEPALLVDLLLHIAREGKVAALLATSGAAYVVYGATLAILTCALKWRLIGRLQSGSIPSSGHGQGSKFRLSLVHSLLRSAHEKVVVLLIGTEALCIYLRSLGAKVGRMASIRRLNALVDPDLLNLEQNCHLGDFSKIITSQMFPGGSVSLGAVRVGNGCVVGAQSVVMPGATLKQRAVLGAMSVAPTGTVLEEGGVYVGLKTPVRIYQQQLPAAADDSHVHREMSKDVGSTGDSEQNREEKEQPGLAEGGGLDPRFRQMIASIAVELIKKTPAGHARYIHYLGSGGKGTMRVLENLPSGLPKHDILSPGATYPVLLRCSNSVSKDDDRCSDLRGATLRVLQPGSPDNLHMPLLDLFMKTGNIFHARNMVEFLGFFIMTDAEKEDHTKRFPAMGESLWGNLRNPNSYAEMHYFGSTTRYFEALPNSSNQSAALPGLENLGVQRAKTSEKMYAKFKLRPADPKFGEDEGSVKPTGELPPVNGMFPASDDDPRSKTYLRDDFKSRLQSSKGIRFVLQMQLHPIPATTKEREEVQDPTQVWDNETHPYMDVAELWLNEHVEDTVFDDIHFNPKNGPPSLAMIPATSATQSASVDQGRSILHDLLGYLRSGTLLPPLWNDLVKKTGPDLVSSAVQERTGDARPSPRCPMMMSGNSIEAPYLKPSNQQNTELQHLIHDDITRNDLKSTLEQQRWNKHDAISKTASDMLQITNLTILRFFQPILQVIAPMALLILALYPSILGLGIAGVNAGKPWMYGLLPFAYLCTGLTFATLSIVCKWVISPKLKDGQTHELWSSSTLCHTVWDSINQTLASTFLELGKGSALCTWYLRALGASIKDTSVYIDTLHVLNPDQLRVGVRTSIGHNALLFGHLYEGEKVAFKSNIIGDDTFVGTRALLLPGLKMDDGAQLESLGLGMKDEVIGFDYSY